MMLRICISIVVACGVVFASSVTNCSEVWANGFGLSGDVNKDCVVDFIDFQLLLSDWVKCNDPVYGCDDVSDVDNTRSILSDGNSDTYIAIDSDWHKFYYGTSIGEYINLRIDVDATSGGELEVGLDDVMVRTIDYEAGQNQYAMRVPFSKTSNVRLRSQGGAVNVPELYLDNRTAVATVWPSSGVVSSAINVSVGSDSTAASYIPFGIMCNWFSRGVVDGITDADSKAELISELNELGISSWRYPGGTMTYGYPPTQEAVQVYKDAGMAAYAYGLNNNPVYWASPQDYFQFCKDAGITAWYEINPGFWYDSVNKEVYKTVPMDGRGDITYTDYLDEAVADAVVMAQYVDTLEIDVVWEIGNEDYVYYTAATYAKLCVAFINGIRAVLPDAKFSVCGDGYSWSDHSFTNDFKDAMATKTITGIIDYSSEHLYLSGVGYTDSTGWHQFDWSTPSGHGDGTVSAWPIIKPQYFNSINNWSNVGFPETKLAVTEFNTNSGSASIPKETEHSVGRALGEAVTAVNMLSDGTDCVFMHDMVRSSPDGTFFARLDFYPENTAGRKYFIYPEAKAVGITSRHGSGKIVYNSGGIAVSRHSDFVYITVVNRDETYKSFNFNLSAVTVNTGISAEVKEFRAASEECSFFDYYYEESQAEVNSSVISINSYPFSVKSYKVYIQ